MAQDSSTKVLYITPKESKGTSAKEVRKDLTRIIKPKETNIKIITVQDIKTETMRMVVDSEVGRK